jgi:NTP pyrophosphatase (non-canonical NTP hydrolase)
MDIAILQEFIRQSTSNIKTPFRSVSEIMLAITEELGEVATEVALIEQIGSKTEWSKSPSIEGLAEEISHVINLLLVLANHYEIDLNQLYTDKEI